MQAVPRKPVANARLPRLNLRFPMAIEASQFVAGFIAVKRCLLMYEVTVAIAVQNAPHLCVPSPFQESCGEAKQTYFRPRAFPGW